MLCDVFAERLARASKLALTLEMQLVMQQGSMPEWACNRSESTLIRHVLQALQILHKRATSQLAWDLQIVDHVFDDEVPGGVSQGHTTCWT